MSPETPITSSGGAMTARQAVALLASENNPEHIKDLLSDSFLAGMTAGENLNDWNDNPTIKADIAVASDVLRIYHAAVARRRWRDLADEQPTPGDAIEARVDGRAFIAGNAFRIDGAWQVVQEGQRRQPIDLWRPKQDNSDFGAADDDECPTAI